MSEVNLPQKACEIRLAVIAMLEGAASGHSAGSLGLADILVCLYNQIFNHDPQNPLWPDRDRLVISNGHVCPLQYAILADLGYFPKTYLKSLRQFGSPLQGHPERTKLPGIETTSGPLGCGLAQAAGMAAAARLDSRRSRTFCLLSDGEHDEGNHWEAVLFAAKYKLNNLTVIVDRNNIQLSGNTEDIMPLEPLLEKYKSFNWNALVIDGHDFGQIKSSIIEARQEYQKPTAIIANTIPGKGVSFMENDYTWHGRAPTPAQAAQAAKELKSHLKDLQKAE